MLFHLEHFIKLARNIPQLQNKSQNFFIKNSSLYYLASITVSAW